MALSRVLKGSLLFASAMLLGTASHASFKKGVDAFNAKEFGLASEYWSLEAAKGDLRASYYLSLLYRLGKGVEQSDRKAILHIREAAAGGYTQAQFDLGSYYLNGVGVDKDPLQAAHWWELAASAGDVRSQHNLASLYLLGKGVDKDIDRAQYWYEQAANGGSKAAAKVLASIDAKNTKTEQAKPKNRVMDSEVYQPPIGAERAEYGAVANKQTVPAQTNDRVLSKRAPLPTIAAEKTVTNQTPRGFAKVPGEDDFVVNLEIPQVKPRRPEEIEALYDRTKLPESTASGLKSDQKLSATTSAPVVSEPSKPQIKPLPKPRPLEPKVVKTQPSVAVKPYPETKAVRPQEVRSVSKPEELRVVRTPPTAVATKEPETVVERPQIEQPRYSAANKKENFTPKATVNKNKAVIPDYLTSGEEWIRSQPSKGITLQIFASDVLSSTENIIEKNRYRRQVAMFSFGRKSETWYGVVYGRFRTVAEARAAANELPTRVLVHTSPWPRSFGQIQEVIGSK